MNYKKENRRSWIENKKTSMNLIKRTSISSKYTKIQSFFRNEDKNRKNVSNFSINGISELNKAKVCEKNSVKGDTKTYRSTINYKSEEVEQTLFSKSSLRFWESHFKTCFPHFDSSIEILTVDTSQPATHYSNESFFTKNNCKNQSKYITKTSSKRQNDMKHKYRLSCVNTNEVDLKMNHARSKSTGSLLSQASSKLLLKNFSYDTFFEKKHIVRTTKSFDSFFTKRKKENRKAHFFADNFSDYYITKKYISDVSLLNKQKIYAMLSSTDGRVLEHDHNSQKFKKTFYPKHLDSRRSQISTSSSESSCSMVNMLDDLFANEEMTAYLTPFYDNIHTKQSAVETLIEKDSLKKILCQYNSKKIIEATEKIKQRDQLEEIVKKNEGLFTFVLMLLVLRVLKEPGVKKELNNLWEKVTKMNALQKDIKELKKLKMKLGKFWELQRDGRLDILRAQKFVIKAKEKLSIQKERFPLKSQEVVYNCGLIFRLIKVLQLENIKEAELIFACAKGKIFKIPKKQYTLLKKLFKAIQMSKKCLEIVTGFEAYRKDLAKKISFFAKENEFL